MNNKINCQYEDPVSIAMALENGFEIDNARESLEELGKMLQELHRCRLALKCISQDIVDANFEKPY